eukprot:SAG11_NODE_5503_length_1543_cov_1.211219_1_plen_87_part_10
MLLNIYCRAVCTLWDVLVDLVCQGIVGSSLVKCQHVSPLIALSDFVCRSVRGTGAARRCLLLGEAAHAAEPTMRRELRLRFGVNCCA